jgi:transducin (beta)-like 1
MEQEEVEAREIPDDQVTKLEGHTSEVFICSWSPTGPLLASG